jgi:hypothetical protein
MFHEFKNEWRRKKGNVHLCTIKKKYVDEPSGVELNEQLVLGNGWGHFFLGYCLCRPTLMFQFLVEPWISNQEHS